MKVPFLSETWFERVQALIAKAGDLKLPRSAKQVEINLTTTDEPPMRASVRSGLFSRGHRRTAKLTMLCPPRIAYDVFMELDPTAGMRAFVDGEVTFEGDIDAILALGEAERTARHDALLDQIRAITARPGRAKATPKKPAATKPRKRGR